MVASNGGNTMDRIRKINAALLAPILRLTGFRFSKEYRWGTTRTQRIVYQLVETVEANLRADGNR